MGPSSNTSTPAAEIPACSADSNIYPEIRVSLPIKILLCPSAANTAPVAQPSRNTKSGVIGYSPTVPRMPSVPKYLRVISRLLGNNAQRGNLLLHCLLHSVGHTQCIHCGSHIVDTQNMSPLNGRPHRQS